MLVLNSIRITRESPCSYIIHLEWIPKTQTRFAHCASIILHITARHHLHLPPGVIYLLSSQTGKSNVWVCTKRFLRLRQAALVHVILKRDGKEI